MDKKKLDRAARKLMGIFEEHAKDLRPDEADAQWRAFTKVVAKIESRLSQ